MERIDLGLVEHVVCRRWVRGHPGEVGHAVVGYGRTVVGQWFVARWERGRALAWVAWGEDHAGDVIQRWINRRGGMRMWVEVRTGDPVALPKLGS